jgi:hypothetical protein
MKLSIRRERNTLVSTVEHREKRKYRNRCYHCRLWRASRHSNITVGEALGREIATRKLREYAPYINSRYSSMPQWAVFVCKTSAFFCDMIFHTPINTHFRGDMTTAKDLNENLFLLTPKPLKNVAPTATRLSEATRWCNQNFYRCIIIISVTDDGQREICLHLF